MGTPSDESTLVPDHALDRLGRILLTDHSMRSLLAEIAELAKRSLPGRVETSVTLVTGNAPSTVVLTGPLARDLDRSQYRHGHGPCLHAAAAGEVVEVADTREDPRWPDFLADAASAGCLSSLSLPLPVHEQITGALNIYAREPAAFDAAARQFAERFAAYAAVVAANMLLYESAKDRARNLQAALDSRAVIDQAMGILMERFKTTPDQAFRTLTRASMETQTKVRDIAARVVRTGEGPGQVPLR